MPGLLVHGAGHGVAGDPCTARKLLTLEAVGLGGALTGGTVIVLTGASRKLITAAVATTGVGMGLFLLSAAADLYGAAGGASVAAEPLRNPPSIEAELGYRFIRDPLFAYRNFSALTVTGRAGPLRLEPSLWNALDDDNARLRFVGAWRVMGPRPEPATRARDGSYVDLEGAYTGHRYGTESFTTRTVEASIRGRYDLARLSPTLGGSFAEMSLGWGLATTQYAFAGAKSDSTDMLLLGLAYGVYLGAPGKGDGELKAFYDHRRDGYAGGLPVPGVGGGVIGHVGLRGAYYFDESWGVGVEAIAGSAWITGIGLRYRVGGRR